ncbi:NYN domain-containing protein [Nostoc sp. MG11]|uniref:NYN domain-containing protein n=1 Tax=Nostoc sp. MG11 TaxID=2721166 RepID=UPI0029FF3C57|nr:NYN domain-containing protein [Nostoc sp. MG11]
MQKLYYNSYYQNQVFAKNHLEFLGFNCVDVPDNTENSADYRLMADCVQLFAPKPSPSPNAIILVVRDWDYAGLICILKTLGKKVIVFAQRGSASPKLIKLVGNENFYFVDELPQLVGNSNKTQPRNTDILSQINYNKAIEYLIEAINTALSQGKPTVFGRIDKLMRQLCANYQGCSSISTSDGKKFKSFSQFIDAAVKDGKVRKQNQELFLIELDRLAA